MFKAATTKINNFNAAFILLFKQYILWLQIAVHNCMLLQEHQTLQNLNGESPDQV